MKKVLIIIAVLIASTQSCKVSYTLSGASIAPEVKTVSVQYFTNRAPLALTNLDQYITNELRDKFKSQTSLTVVSDVGHLNFEGEITDYNTRPTAIVGDETAAQNRLTVSTCEIHQ